MNALKTASPPPSVGLKRNNTNNLNHTSSACSGGATPPPAHPVTVWCTAGGESSGKKHTQDINPISLTAHSSSWHSSPNRTLYFPFSPPLSPFFFPRVTRGREKEAVVYADPGLIRNDVWQAQALQNYNRLPRAFNTVSPLSIRRSITSRLKTSLKGCFLKYRLLSVKVTYDALTGLISDGDQQRGLEVHNTQQGKHPFSLCIASNSRQRLSIFFAPWPQQNGHLS